MIGSQTDNQTGRIIGAHIDIDRQKTSELELSKYREGLEEMVAVRTNLLEETQAELVNKALEAGRAQLSSHDSA